MFASFLNLMVLGTLFLPAFFLAGRPRPLNAGTVMSVLGAYVAFFLALGILLQAFPNLIDPRGPF